MNPTKGSSPTPEHRRNYEIGGRMAELNTILGKIRRSRDGEPTASQRARLAELKTEINNLKTGKQTNGSEEER